MYSEASLHSIDMCICDVGSGMCMTCREMAQM